MAGVLGIFLAIGMGLLLISYPLDTRRFGFSTIFAALLLLAVSGVSVVLTNRDGSSVRLTIPTIVTLGRGAILAVFVGMFISAGADGALRTGGVSLSTHMRWLLGSFFVIAGLLDAVDGGLARHLDAGSDLGSRMDTEIDGSLTLAGAIVVVLIGAASPFFLLVGMARYLFVGGLWLIRTLGRTTAPLQRNRFRAPLSALVLVAIMLALLPIVPETLTRMITIFVGVPFLVNFAWDWLGCAGFRSDMTNR